MFGDAVCHLGRAMTFGIFILAVCAVLGSVCGLAWLVFSLFVRFCEPAFASGAVCFQFLSTSRCKHWPPAAFFLPFERFCVLALASGGFWFHLLSAFVI